jgi:hypothetical protein
VEPIHFEAVKVSQNTEKHYVTFAVHPEDVGNLLDFYGERVGSRYVVAIAPIGDNEELIPVMEKTEGRNAYESFSLLCRNERFRKWLFDGGFSDGFDECAAVAGVKKYVGIKSRSELIENISARNKFVAIRNTFYSNVKGKRNE